jgi:transketolase
MTVSEPVSQMSLDTVAELAAQLRVDSVRASTSAGSGHPTSSMSAADLLAVLVARHLRYDWEHPHAPGNDHLIFSKGHASPLLYAVFKAVGVVSDDELLNGYRRFGQRLEGHPTPVLPWVDVATGSLGQGLPDAVGIALAGRYLEKLPYRVWVLCGDSEMAEGSMWEALDKASYYKLANLIAIVDVNRLGQRGETELGWDLCAYARRAEAFGARVLTVDGHDVAGIDTALSTASDDTTGERPTVIFARTRKGRGFSEVEDQDDWHGKPLPPDMAQRAIAELGGARNLVVRGPRPEPAPAPATGEPADVPLPTYDLGEKVATRKAYGDALVSIGARDPRIVALDGEVSNSTYTSEFAHAYPERYFEMFIAEQQMIAAATGLAVRGYRPFASTFAAFLTRAHDFIRMGAISGVDVRLVGSHAGVEIGADGPSQMALEDLAMLRAVHGSTVLYPSDATSTAALVEAMATTPASAICALPAAPTPPATGPASPSLSAAPRSSAPAMTSPSSARASPCTPALPRRTSSPPRVSTPASSTATRSSRLTPRRSPRQSMPPSGALSSPKTTTPRVASAPPSATPCSPPAAPTSLSRTSPCAACPAPELAPNYSPGRASTPITSPPPRGACWQERDMTEHGGGLQFATFHQSAKPA